MSVLSVDLIFWPVQPPARLPGGLAATIERERAQKGDYPPEWPAVAWLVKTIAGWKCERCGHPHSGTMADGWGLTVHHLDKVKWNLEHWNLAALCQRCHLKIEHRVNWYQVWAFEHSPWMARHVLDYNEWAGRQPCSQCDNGTDYSRAYEAVPGPTGEPQPRGPEPCDACYGTGHLPLLPIVGIAEPRDYSQDWPS